MKNKLALIAVIAIASIACARWCEFLEVRYLDSVGLPVPDATASVQFQKNDFYHYDGSASAKTGPNGIAQIGFCDEVPDEYEIRDFTITVLSPYDDSETRKTFPGENRMGTGAHLEDFFLDYPLFDVEVTAVKGFSQPMANLELQLRSPYETTRITDGSGKTAFRLKGGSNMIVYGEADGTEARLEREVDGKLKLTLSFGGYNNALELVVKNKEDEPVENANVSVQYGGKAQEKKTDAEGKAVFTGIDSLEVAASVFYRGTMQTANITLDQEFETLNFSVETNALNISNVTATAQIYVACSNISVMVEASDNRLGLDNLSVSVRYSFSQENGTISGTRPANLSGGVFEAVVDCGQVKLPSNFSFTAMVKNPWEEKTAPERTMLLEAKQPAITTVQNASATQMEERVEVLGGYVGKNLMNLFLGAIIMISVIVLIVLMIITVTGKKKKVEGNSHDELKAIPKQASRSGMEEAGKPPETPPGTPPQQ